MKTLCIENAYSITTCWKNLLLIVVLLVTATLTYAQDSVKPEQKQQQSAKDKTDKAKPSTTDNSPNETKVSANKLRETIKFPINSAQQQQQDLKHFDHNNQLQTMLAGQDEFVFYFHPQNTAYSKGVAILVPDWQQSALEPRAIGQLAKYLPDQGWTVISVQPPAKPDDYPIVSRDLTVAAEQNQKLLEQYQQKLTAMMTKIMERAAQYPGIFLVISQGQNSANLLALYQNNAVKRPSALVLLSAFALDSASQQNFTKQVANTRLPILDLLLQEDNPLAINQAETRRQQVARQLKQQYRQRQLKTVDLTGYYPAQTTYRIINGWLKSLGW